MQVICDIEANSLTKPTKIWCIVCKDVATDKVEIFRELVTNEVERERFRTYSSGVTRWVGHNFLGYDWPVIRSLIRLDDCDIAAQTIDTLIISKLVNYSRDGHSVEDYGVEFGLPKIKFNDFTHWSQEMEDYCVRDVHITHRIYDRYLHIVNDPTWTRSILLEHRFQLVCNDLHTAGFGFNSVKAEALRADVEAQLQGLDDKILEAFPPKEVLIREFTPKLTKFGTISRTSVPRSLADKIHLYSAGQTYRHTRLDNFNPSSHKQIIEVLNEAGWQPEDKTTTHVNTERELQRLKYTREPGKQVDLEKLSAKLEILKKSGWKVNENNLLTLPETAPPPARLLAKRILLEARRRSLVEWLGLVVDGRIHGRFQGIGAWTHRMAHQQPNMANIPNAVKISDGSPRLLGKEMRSLWCAPNRRRLLVGVDAEAIQFRIFAHLINDKELINSIVNGKKSDKTDPHSLNQVVFGPNCKTRNAAKHSMFAIFFGGRANKISQIMGCTKAQAEEAIGFLLKRYPGLKALEDEVFPRDARRGWFEGLDGRKVKIPGDTVGARKHLCMSGYLQAGEKVIMALATLEFEPKLKDFDSFLVDLVHDEWQTETPNDMFKAVKVAELQANALIKVGVDLNLNCPLAGSYWNDDTNRYTIGTNWYATH